MCFNGGDRITVFAIEVIRKHKVVDAGWLGVRTQQLDRHETGKCFVFTLIEGDRAYLGGLLNELLCFPVEPIFVGIRPQVVWSGIEEKFHHAKPE